MTRAIFSIRLRALSGRIHTELYSDTRSRRANLFERQQRITELHEEIEIWHNSLPSYLLTVERPLSLFMTSDWSTIVYNSAILQLYRTELTDNPKSGADDTIAVTCANAAAQICHAYRRQYVGKPTTLTWGALHELFLASFTYIYCLWTSSAVRESLSIQEVNSTCNDSTIAFVILAERWQGAGPYRDLFEALTSKTLAMLSITGSTTQANAASISSTQSGTQVYADNLPEWVSTVGGGLRGSMQMEQMLYSIVD